MWTDLFIQPTSNFLIYLYNTFAFGNLGLAIVELTILVRIVLLPLSIIIEGNRNRYEELNEEMNSLERQYHQDIVSEKEARRTLFTKYSINPWANFLLLVLQFFVLLVLYTVFAKGLEPQNIEFYSWVENPGVLDTSFLGLFDVAKRNFIVSAIIAAIVFIRIVIAQRGQDEVSKSDKMFRIFFPTTVLIALWALPSVKAVYIATSILFSYVIHKINDFGLKRK